MEGRFEVTLARFRDEPWKVSHRLYTTSQLSVAPAPEYASSEVVLASLYRVIGFPSLSEFAVPQLGRDLDREIQRYRDRQRAREGAALDAGSFHVLLHSSLESPRLPSQSSKRFLQVTPLVPDAAVFSGAPRLAGSPWSAGALVRRMVSLGAGSEAEAQQTWSDLFDALSVLDDDDIFARFLQREIGAWLPDPQWTSSGLEDEPRLDPGDRDGLSYPARQFAHDLRAVIGAKGAMTRRQWTSILEAILRIATVSHVIWLCDRHASIWSLLRKAMAGESPASLEAARAVIFPNSFSYMSYGDRALPPIKDRASGYLRARLGINALLWAMEELGEVPGALGSSAGILRLARAVARASSRLQDLGILDLLDDLLERENRAILCSKGIGSNLMEFSRHVLGQRQTASAVLRGYDQGYALRKKGGAKSAPWVVALGPVAVLALVHCSLAGSGGPRSVRRLAQQLAAYGINIDHRDIAKNDMGHQLRMLGLVLDSPDAESGMLLVPPFAEPSA